MFWHGKRQDQIAGQLLPGNYYCQAIIAGQLLGGIFARQLAKMPGIPLELPGILQFAWQLCELPGNLAKVAWQLSENVRQFGKLPGILPGILPGNLGKLPGNWQSCQAIWKLPGNLEAAGSTMKIKVPKLFSNPSENA